MHVEGSRSPDTLKNSTQFRNPESSHMRNTVKVWELMLYDMTFIEFRNVWILSIQKKMKGRQKRNLEILPILIVVNLLFQQMQCANRPNIILVPVVLTAISLYLYSLNQQKHCFLLIYFNNKPLNVSSRLAAHHQEDLLCIFSSWYYHELCCLAAANSQSTYV
jgi:hypothetical protein